jgi:hypothetical protein
VAADLEEPREPGAAEDRAVRLDGVSDTPRGEEDDDAANQEREQDGEERRDEAACLLEQPVAASEALA